MNIGATEKPKHEKTKTDDSRKESSSWRVIGTLYTLQWWLLILIVLWVAVVLSIITSPEYSRIFDELQEGIRLTIFLTLTSYFLAIMIGLGVGLVRAYRPVAPEPGMKAGQFITRGLYATLYNTLSLYVEFMRGIPPIVFLLIVGFIIVPAISDPIINNVLNPVVVPVLRAFTDLWNNTLGQIQISAIGFSLKMDYLALLGTPLDRELVWRGRDPATAILGLSLIYGAFLSEVFRGGIQSIDRGQMEAAKSLGMSFLQAMRHIIVPQAIRRVLPELGNNFISMIKDTSLVTILGTAEITQLARQWSGSSFQYLQTYAVLSLIYLTMTVLGSLLVQLIERNLSQHRR